MRIGYKIRRLSDYNTNVTEYEYKYFKIEYDYFHDYFNEYPNSVPTVKVTYLESLYKLFFFCCCVTI